MTDKLPIGGGIKKVLSTLAMARRIGMRASSKALTSRNACKACGLGMGGQRGGMTNELDEFPSVCNKSIQAQSTDNQAAIPLEIFEHSLSELQALSGKEAEHLGRLNTPLYKAKGAHKFEPLSWREAMGIATDRLAQTKAERCFFYASGRSSNEAGYLLQLLARAKGTNNVNNCSYFCHQATGVALQNTIGTATATVQLADLQQSDLIFIIGANPASNHPRLIHALKNCRDRGGQVVVINPVKEPGLVRFALPKNARSLLAGGHEIASIYLQPNVGSDTLLFAAIAKLIVSANQQNHNFIEKYCNKFDDYRDDLESLSWDEITTGTGLRRNDIQHVADIYSASKATIFCWGMGLTHHLSGVDTLESLVGLALLRGHIGKPGAGLLPLRGHSNVQGMGTVGVKPTLTKDVVKALGEVHGLQSPPATGMDTMACLRAAHAGSVDFALMLGGNLLEAAPDTQWSKTALERVGFKMFLTTTLNRGHLHSTGDNECLILPVAARDEEWQATTQESMFSYVRLSDGGIQRLDNVHSEVAILSELGASTLPAHKPLFVTLESHKAIRTAMAKCLENMQGLASVDETRAEFHIPTRHLSTPTFATPRGKAQFATVKRPPQTTNPKYPLRLISTRSEGQFNTIIYEEFDSYRGINERHAILINPDDMLQLGLSRGDKIHLRSAVGELSNFTAYPFDIQRGAVLGYYPETNPLISQALDPRSETPAYKSVPIAIAKQTLK